MTATPRLSAETPSVPPVRSSPRRLARVGALAGAVAALCTTVLAAVASAADVPLEVEHEAIPLAAFAWWTHVGAALGVLLARVLGERRRFVPVTTVAAGLAGPTPGQPV